jgi:hypothetical protein
MSIPDFADASKSSDELFLCPPGRPCPKPTPRDPDLDRPFVEVLEKKQKGRWVRSPEAQKKLEDCLGAATDNYVKKVDTLNSDAFWGWADNSAQYTLGTFGLPTSIGAVRDALKEPGAKVRYGWGPSITINGKRANPPSVPGGRILFWANFAILTGAYIHVQGSANQTSAELFKAYTDVYFFERNECIRSTPYDTFVLDP